MNEHVDEPIVRVQLFNPSILTPEQANNISMFLACVALDLQNPEWRKERTGNDESGLFTAVYCPSNSQD